MTKHKKHVIHNFIAHWGKIKVLNVTAKTKI